MLNLQDDNMKCSEFTCVLTILVKFDIYKGIFCKEEILILYQF